MTNRVGTQISDSKPKMTKVFFQGTPFGRGWLEIGSIRFVSPVGKLWFAGPEVKADELDGRSVVGRGPGLGAVFG